MNINTLKQELNKKLPRMSEENLIEFVYELHRVWKNTHNDEKYGDRWKALRTFDKTKKKAVVVIEALEDVRAEIEELYVGDVCAKEHNCDKDVLDIIDRKIAEVKGE